MPSSFKNNYPHCRVIIDCTEMFVKTPNSLQYRILLYSDYKSHMTFKALIAISPCGVATFSPDLYNVSASDKQITEESELVNICEQGDGITVDKGSQLLSFFIFYCKLYNV